SHLVAPDDQVAEGGGSAGHHDRTAGVGAVRAGDDEAVEDATGVDLRGPYHLMTVVGVVAFDADVGREDRLVLPPPALVAAGLGPGEPAVDRHSALHPERRVPVGPRRRLV